jgi:hypothetical protein
MDLLIAFLDKFTGEELVALIIFVIFAGVIVIAMPGDE